MSVEIPSNWIEKENSLVRIFIFKDFSSCVLFVQEIAKLAESIQHHPDISIFSYKHVKVVLSTHDEGNTITDQDVTMANQINDIFTLRF